MVLFFLSIMNSVDPLNFLFMHIEYVRRLDKVVLRKFVCMYRYGYNTDKRI